MNIMENKRLAAVSLVMALAFGGICYYGYGRYSALKETQAKITELNNRLEDYASESNTPTAKNRELATQAAKDTLELSKKLDDDLQNYATFCVAGQGSQSGMPMSAVPGPKAAVEYKRESNPNTFQHNFTALVAALGEKATQSGCQIDPAAAHFGNFSKYEKETATADEVPCLNFFLFAVNNAALTVMDSGAPAIRKIYFRAPEPAAQKDGMTRLSFEIAFTAKRSELIDPAKPETLSVLPQVINKLTHDSHYFYIPTGMAVYTRESLPEADMSKLPVDASSATGEEDEVTGEVAQQRQLLAAPLVGKADETVDVYLTLQVLYFNKFEKK